MGVRTLHARSVARWRRGLGAATALLLCLGCGSEPLRPPDPALSGVWIGPPGVDTWDGVTLQQRGELVTGTHDYYSANFGGSVSHVRLGGVADLPHVLLQWMDGDYRIVATGLLSPDSMVLTLTDSAAGYPAGRYPQVYRRARPAP